MSDQVRVRFAPSPTGYLHVGGARTALYNYLYAKKHGGKFILRIEDTDEARSTEESLRMQISDLKWLGLDWDEGPDVETLQDIGEFGPYRQSQRKEIYLKYAEQLVASGHAFYCFMTDEELETQRNELKVAGKSIQIKSPYRDMSVSDAKKKMDAGEKAVIRFRIPDEVTEYVHQDLVRGEVKWPSDVVGDYVLVRAGGMPVYNFVCAIDDALMKVTHVFRAEEHLNNTLRQRMVLEALDLPIPQYGHLSIILGADKQKLSKRHGATSCNEYKESGYLPEALNNFIALLGWSHPQGEEIFSMANLVENFTHERFNSSPAVFDEIKLKWVNSMHLRNLPNDKLWFHVEPVLKKAGLSFEVSPEWVENSLNTFKSYMETFMDAVELYKPLDSSQFQIQKEAADTLSWETTKSVVETWKNLVSGATEDYLSEEQFSEFQNQVKTDCGVKGKNLFMPIRVAVIGKPHGAELKILVPLISKQELINRADKVLAKIG